MDPNYSNDVGENEEKKYLKKKKPTKQWKCYLDISHVMAVINS